MQINLDLTELTLANTPLEGAIYSQVKTDIVFGVQNAENGTLNGNSCALLGVDGKTLAHAIISENKAILNTDTAECYEYVSSLVIEEKRLAYLVVGSGDAPIAVLPIEVMRNPLASIAPPTALAPSYPTSEALKTILAQMTAQAKRAEDAVGAVEEAQKAVAEYVDEVFPTKVTEAEKTLENAVTEASTALDDKVVAIDAHLESAQTAILGNIDTKAQAVSTALDNKVAEANTALDGKVTEANQAKTDAVKARGEAEGFKGQAEGFAEQASTSASNASKSAEQAEDAKEAIGDVGGRLGAVETSVGEKKPYLSKYLTDKFDVLRGKFNMQRVEILTQLHEGFLMRDYYSQAKDRLLIPAINQIIQVDSVGTVRLSVIEDTQTTIYSYSGSTFYKTTVSGSGEGLTFARETITAMPTAVDALSDGIVGYKTANGYIVCTKGHILSADLEVEVATFYAVTSYQRILKDGKNFYFYDGAIKKLATLTLAEDGAPTITYNGYMQTDGTFFPITSTCHVKRNGIGLYIGATAEGIGYLYRESSSKKRLFGVSQLKQREWGRYPLLFFMGEVVALFETESNVASEYAMPVAVGLFDDVDVIGTRSVLFAKDFKGNILYAYVSLSSFSMIYNLFRIK